MTEGRRCKVHGTESLRQKDRAKMNFYFSLSVGVLCPLFLLEKGFEKYGFDCGCK